VGHDGDGASSTHGTLEDNESEAADGGRADVWDQTWETNPGAECPGNAPLNPSSTTSSIPLPSATDHMSLIMDPATIPDPFPAFSNPLAIDPSTLTFGVEQPLDIWQLLTSDALVGADSIQASPHFLDSLGFGGAFLKSSGATQETIRTTTDANERSTLGGSIAGVPASDPTPEGVSVRGGEALSEVQSLVRDLVSCTSMFLLTTSRPA
jgi:hypothetical protein